MLHCFVMCVIPGNMLALRIFQLIESNYEIAFTIFMSFIA